MGKAGRRRRTPEQRIAAKMARPLVHQHRKEVQATERLVNRLVEVSPDELLEELAANAPADSEQS